MPFAEGDLYSPDATVEATRDNEREVVIDKGMRYHALQEAIYYADLSIPLPPGHPDITPVAHAYTNLLSPAAVGLTDEEALAQWDAACSVWADARVMMLQTDFVNNEKNNLAVTLRDYAQNRDPRYAVAHTRNAALTPSLVTTGTYQGDFQAAEQNYIETALSFYIDGLRDVDGALPADVETKVSLFVARFKSHQWQELHEKELQHYQDTKGFLPRTFENVRHWWARPASRKLRLAIGIGLGATGVALAAVGQIPAAAAVMKAGAVVGGINRFAGGYLLTEHAWDKAAATKGLTRTLTDAEIDGMTAQELREHLAARQAETLRQESTQVHKIPDVETTQKLEHKYYNDIMGREIEGIVTSASRAGHSADEIVRQVLTHRICAVGTIMEHQAGMLTAAEQRRETNRRFAVGKIATSVAGGLMFAYLMGEAGKYIGDQINYVREHGLPSIFGHHGAGGAPGALIPGQSGEHLAPDGTHTWTHGALGSEDIQVNGGMASINGHEYPIVDGKVQIGVDAVGHDGVVDSGATTLVDLNSGHGTFDGHAGFAWAKPNGELVFRTHEMIDPMNTGQTGAGFYFDKDPSGAFVGHVSHGVNPEGVSIDGVKYADWVAQHQAELPTFDPSAHTIHFDHIVGSGSTPDHLAGSIAHQAELLNNANYHMDPTTHVMSLDHGLFNQNVTQMQGALHGQFIDPATGNPTPYFDHVQQSGFTPADWTKLHEGAVPIPAPSGGTPTHPGVEITPSASGELEHLGSFTEFQAHGFSTEVSGAQASNIKGWLESVASAPPESGVAGVPGVDTVGEYVTAHPKFTLFKNPFGEYGILDRTTGDGGFDLGKTISTWLESVKDTVAPSLEPFPTGTAV